jgi:hypothetical protein
VLFAIDGDGTLFMDRPYEDVDTPLELRAGCRVALESMKAAGHVHLLWTARGNRSLLFTPTWDPLVANGTTRFSEKAWRAARDLHWARWQHVCRFVREELDGLIDAIDPGLQGKPLVDIFLDDRTPAGPVDWRDLRLRYGAW